MSTRGFTRSLEHIPAAIKSNPFIVSVLELVFKDAVTVAPLQLRPVYFCSQPLQFIGVFAQSIFRDSITEPLAAFHACACTNTG